jgi:hypothetical protein
MQLHDPPLSDRLIKIGRGYLNQTYTESYIKSQELCCICKRRLDEGGASGKRSNAGKAGKGQM